MRLIFLAIFLFSFSVLFAESISVYDIDASDYPIIKAKLIVLDGNGNQINNISATDFQLLENGQPRDITDISCSEYNTAAAVSSVLTIDVSGSMRGTRLSNAKAAAYAWIDGLPLGRSESAITTFNFDNYYNQDFTTNRSKLKAAIDALDSYGGTDFNAGFIDQIAGALLAVQNAKHKKVIVFLTDGEASGNEDDIIRIAKEVGVTIYCVTLDVPCPVLLKNISEQTGGQWFENITTQQQAKEVYTRILNIEQGTEPCEIQWESGTSCSLGDTEIELTYLDGIAKTESSYPIQSNDIAMLKFEPANVHFADPVLGSVNTKSVKVTAVNSSFSVSDIESSNPRFSISHTNFTVLENESTNISITYTPVDSGYNSSTLKVNSDICQQSLYASGGFNGIGPSEPTLNVVRPNGNEDFAIGSNEIIIWEGISPIDTVSIEYSIDKGLNWIRLTDEASDFKFDWNSIPRPISDECLVRINQLSKNPILDRPYQEILVDNGGIYRVDYSDDGIRIATIGFDKTVKIWDWNSGSLLNTMSGHGSAAFDIDFSPNGDRVVTVSLDDTCRVWNSTTGDLLLSFSNRSFGLFSVAYSPDGSIIATGGQKGKVVLWDAFTGDKITTYQSGEIAISGLTFSPDGRYLASNGAGGVADIWDVTSDQRVLTLSKHDSSIQTIAYSPDGKFIATASYDNTARLWDALNGNLLHTLRGHKEAVRSVSFSSDGTQVATASLDHSAKIWDSQSGKLILTLLGHTNDVYDIAFNPTGDGLITASLDGTIKLWNPVVAPLQSDVSDDVFSIVEPQAQAVDIDMGDCLFGQTIDSIINEFTSNNSNWNVRVDSIYFKGPDKDAFFLVAGLPVYNLPPSSSEYLELSFSPSRTGQHNAEIVIITQSDTLIRDVSGIGIQPRLDYFDGILDFGEVEIGDESIIADTVILKNIGNSTIDITNTVLMSPDTEQFEIIDGGGVFSLLPDEERRVSLRFKPIYGGRTSGRIGFEYDGVGSPATVQLFGTGIGGILIAPKDSAFVGEDKNLSIKLGNISANDLMDIAQSFSLDMTFQNTIITPQDKSTISDKRNDTVTVSIRQDISQNMDFASIAVTAGLGTVEESEISISNFVLYDENGEEVDYDMEYEFGNFKVLGICREGGTRLIDADAQINIKTVSPNPSVDYLDITLSLIENGYTELAIYNSSGNKVKSIYQNDIILNGLDKKDIQINTDIGDLGSGKYTLVLNTPTYTESKPIIVIK